jgi:hypothetical protein
VTALPSRASPRSPGGADGRFVSARPLGSHPHDEGALVLAAITMVLVVAEV